MKQKTGMTFVSVTVGKSQQPKESKSFVPLIIFYFCHSGGAQSAKPVDHKSYVTDEQQQQQVGDERGAIVEPEHDVLVLFEDKQIE